MESDLPPNMTEDCKVILFDGVCKLCNSWSRFIIRYDNNNVFKLASVQSIEGQKILKHFEMPTASFDTMLYVEGNQYFSKSDAFFTIMKQLDYPWKAVVLFQLIPRLIRDWLYDRIALNRYTLFGQYEQCILPTPDHDKRFLKHGE